MTDFTPDNQQDKKEIGIGTMELAMHNIMQQKQVDEEIKESRWDSRIEREG